MSDTATYPPDLTSTLVSLDEMKLAGFTTLQILVLQKIIAHGQAQTAACLGLIGKVADRL